MNPTNAIAGVLTSLLVAMILVPSPFGRQGEGGANVLLPTISILKRQRFAQPRVGHRQQRVLSGQVEQASQVYTADACEQTDVDRRQRQRAGRHAEVRA